MAEYNVLVPGATCSALPPVPHSTPNTTRAVVGTAVAYTCDYGYWFPDHNVTLSTTCTEAREWGPYPQQACEGKT